jgi:hypothetical protein
MTTETSTNGRPPGARLSTLPRGAGDKPQETCVAANPRDPRHVIVSFHQAVGDGSDHHPEVRDDVLVAWSVDAGETWTVAEGTSHPGYRVSIDAAVAFDARGYAYLVYIGMDEMSSTTRHGEFVLRSMDGGRTWEGPTALVESQGGGTPILNHMPHVIADIHADSPHGGNVYVIWDRQTWDPDARPLALLKEEIVFVRSTDAGQSWSEPRAIATYPSSVGHGLAVGRDGTLYVMAIIITAEGSHIEIIASRDGGETFGPPITVARGLPRALGVSNFPRACGLPVIAIDSRDAPGRLFVVWGDHRNGDRDIFATTSDDGGTTWSSPVRVNDDPASNGRDQVMSWLAVDQTDGAAYVLFYDRRDDPSNAEATVSLARSTDGGRTFTNYAWSDRPSDPRQACLGDYIGLAALDGYVYGAWVENVDGQPERRLRESNRVMSGDMELDQAEWPFGPTVIRIGVADFRTAFEPGR